MTDYRSVEELTVRRDSLKVGTLRRLSKGCEFRYTAEFLQSGQEAIALHLPVDHEGIRVEGIANLPTYFAGLLPEGIMFNAVRTVIGAAADDLFAVLAATGSDSIGDIDVQIEDQLETKTPMNLEDAAELIRDIVGHKFGPGTERITAIPGVQPKISLGEVIRASRTTRYIAKFESPDFPNLVSNEHAVMQMANKCGVDVAKTTRTGSALLVKRFDRVYDRSANLMTKIHVEDLIQVMDLMPNSKYTMEFAELMIEIDRLGASKATLLDALRLYVFSYLIGNGDLHAKNISVLRDSHNGQWRLTPAYDLISTLPYLDRMPGDRMALALLDESFGRFTASEFVEFGLRFGLPERATVKMVDSLCSGVSAHIEMVHTMGFDGATTASVKDEILRRVAGLVAR